MSRFVLLCIQCTTTTSSGELILYIGPLTKLYKGKVHPKLEFQPFTTQPCEEALVKFSNPHKCFRVWGRIPPKASIMEAYCGQHKKSNGCHIKKINHLFWIVADKWNKGLGFSGHSALIDDDLTCSDCFSQTWGGRLCTCAQYYVMLFKLMYPSFYEKLFVSKRKQNKTHTVKIIDDPKTGRRRFRKCPTD